MYQIYLPPPNEVYQAHEGSPGLPRTMLQTHRMETRSHEFRLEITAAGNATYSILELFCIHMLNIVQYDDLPPPGL